jgi:ribose transport system permease protein
MTAISAGRRQQLAEFNESLTRSLRRRARVFALIGFNLAIMLIVDWFYPGFLGIANIQVIIDGMALPAAVAAAQALLLAAGRFDLAVGGVAALAGILVGDMMVRLGIPAIPAVFLGLLFGAAVGLTNGIFIERFKLNSIVMTLATWWIMLGVAQGITQGNMPGGFSNGFQTFGQKRIFGFLIGDYYSLIIVSVIGVFFAYRRFGYHVLATGGDREASRRKGIRVDRVGITLFTISGLVAAFAGICFAAQLGSGQTNAYYNLALETIAAAVIGGAGLNGGEGSVLGTVFGLLLLNMTTNALIFLGWSSLWSQAIYGAVLVAAITIDNIVLRLRARRARASTLQRVDDPDSLAPTRSAQEKTEVSTMERT